MQDIDPRWSPRIRDPVHIRTTGATGEVADIIGAGDDRRFVVVVWPAPSDQPPSAQSVAHRICTLAELAPVRRP